MTARIDGLLRDKTRPSRIAPLPARVHERTVASTLFDPPAEATHWTAAIMAKTVGISVSSVQRCIWRAYGLQPHRVRQFKLSRDAEFVPKLRDIVGLYVDPPAHAIVLSVEEKSQIQALDPTQPGLPLKSAAAGPMTTSEMVRRRCLRLSTCSKARSSAAVCSGRINLIKDQMAGIWKRRSKWAAHEPRTTKLYDRRNDSRELG
jgi:hypothetical protein